MALRGRWRAYEALVRRLHGINGYDGGYWINLDGAVYTRLIRPEDGIDVPPVYVCLPLVATTPTPTTHETYVTEIWRQPIWRFVNETSEVRDTAQATKLFKLADDIYRAVASDYTLGGTCDDSEFVSGGDETAGVLIDDITGEGLQILQLQQRWSAADLGPLATA